MVTTFSPSTKSIDRDFPPEQGYQNMLIKLFKAHMGLKGFTYCVIPPFEGQRLESPHIHVYVDRVVVPNPGLGGGASPNRAQRSHELIMTIDIVDQMPAPDSIERPIYRYTNIVRRIIEANVQLDPKSPLRLEEFPPELAMKFIRIIEVDYKPFEDAGVVIYDNARITLDIQFSLSRGAALGS